MTTKTNSLQPRRRMWIKFGITKIEIKTDLSVAAQMGEFKVAALRSDNEWFALPVVLDIERANRHKGWEGVTGLHQMMSETLGQLESYRDCDCVPSNKKTCKTHTPPEPN